VPYLSASAVVIHYEEALCQVYAPLPLLLLLLGCMCVRVCVCVWKADERWREFSMGVTCVSDSFGITVAAAVAIPVHNYFCTLPRLS